MKKGCWRDSPVPSIFEASSSLATPGTSTLPKREGDIAINLLETGRKDWGKGAQLVRVDRFSFANATLRFKQKFAQCPAIQQCDQIRTSVVWNLDQTRPVNMYVPSYSQRTVWCQHPSSRSPPSTVLGWPTYISTPVPWTWTCSSRS